MGEFSTLYIDMNSFFASVEQHENPNLLGRPVAITALTNDAGCCVAASYEAKALGVTTCTSVRDAKRICPDITLIPSRHRLYVKYNLRIAEILDQMAELERIRSVDEFQLGLSGPAAEEAGAFDLVRRMKARVAHEIGPAIRFSAGIGPNHLLAKIAGKLEKPDGCQWLSPRNMPDRLSDLALDDLPGISRGVMAKLDRAGIRDIPALYALDPRHARMIWNSVEGERFVRALQGENIPLGSTSRHGYGNSKILGPDARTLKQAYLVSRWLLSKSANRLRRDGYVSRRVSIHARFGEGGWARSIKCEANADTPYLLALHRQMWLEIRDRKRPRVVLSVGVHLGDILPLRNRCGDLLHPLAPGELRRGEKVSALADQINGRFGRETITFGADRPHHGFFERG